MNRNRLSVFSAMACACIGFGCSDNAPVKDPPVCEPGVVRCVSDNHSMMTCNEDGFWEMTDPCPSDAPVCDTQLNICVPETVQKVCVAGFKRCVGTDAVRTCKDDGTWGDPETCPESTPFCDVNRGMCVESCVPGEVKCMEDGLATCQLSGIWGEAVSCPVDTPKCNESRHACEESCDPGDFQCVSGDGYIVCQDNGVWGDIEACPEKTPVCRDDQKACVSSCSPGEKKCVDRASIKTCGEDGLWGEKETCGLETPLCDGLKNACVSNIECVADTDFCYRNEADPSDVARMMHCAQDGVPERTLYLCGSGCNADNTACQCDFVPDQASEIKVCLSVPQFDEDGLFSELSANYYAVCSEAGVLTAPVACPDDRPLCLGTGECVACTPGEIKCSEDLAAVLTCMEDGSWGEPAACPEETPLCIGSGVCAQCQPEENKCQDELMLSTCMTNGMWGDPVPCIEPTPKCDADQNLCVADCEPGAMKCVSETSMISCLPSGVWSEETACPEEASACDEETGRCAIYCDEENARKCSGNRPMVCHNGSWELAVEDGCGDDAVCSDLLGAVCVPKNAMCDPSKVESVCHYNQIFTCDNGILVPSDPCGSKTICVQSQEEESLKTAASCEAVNLCGQTYGFCYSNTINGICKDGVSAVTRSCGLDKKCLSFNLNVSLCSDEAVVCNEMAFSCDNSVLSACRYNKLVRLTDCGAYGLACDAEKMACVASE